MGYLYLLSYNLCVPGKRKLNRNIVRSEHCDLIISGLVYNFGSREGACIMQTSSGRRHPFKCIYDYF